MKKSSPGVTLLELIVAIAAGAIVMAAALTFLLLGTRMEGRAFGTAENQQTARIVLTVTEKMAVSGDINKIENVGESWVLYSDENKPLLQYLSADGSLRAGDSILMRNLKSATATFDATNSKLFTLTLETEYEDYSTTVYCRNGEIAHEEITEDKLLNETKADGEFAEEATYNGRLEFLTTLCNQYGSRGEIIGSADGDPKYFSEWYIKQQEPSYQFNETSSWNPNTPWCACFISWGAAQNNSLDNNPDTLTQSEHYFANVDSGMEVFKNTEKPGSWLPTDAIPTPGDIVFFSWDGDDDPEHVGAVLHIDGGFVYTIEGNSGGRVTVNKYALDSRDIIGYGVLAWN